MLGGRTWHGFQSAKLGEWICKYVYRGKDLFVCNQVYTLQQKNSSLKKPLKFIVPIGQIVRDLILGGMDIENSWCGRKELGDEK